MEKKHGSGAVVLFSQNSVLERDFEVAFECEDLNVPRMWTEVDDLTGRTYAMLCFVPEVFPCQVVFGGLF